MYVLGSYSQILSEQILMDLAVGAEQFCHTVSEVSELGYGRIEVSNGHYS